MSHLFLGAFVGFAQEAGSNNQPGIVEARIILVRTSLVLLVLDSELISAKPLYHAVNLDDVHGRIASVDGEKALLAALSERFRQIRNGGFGCIIAIRGIPV
jgi:hypothetical protein